MMKKVTTIITNIVIAVLFIFLSIILTEHPTNKTILRGNKTIHKDIVLNDGLISPGNSPGKITITGDFTMDSSATYKCELKDLTGAGSGHDQIDISGNLILSGSLIISLLGYTPNNTDQFTIMKYGGTLSESFSSITGLPAGWKIDYGVLFPGKITIYGSDSVTPIELLNFRAKKVERQVILTWQTASEQNSDYFIIEHSTDAKTFTSLERVMAQRESRSIHDYSYSDKNPATNINYYRLKQVDLDRKFTYSNITSVVFNTKNISFYPNPASKTIFFNKPIESVIIQDMQGKEIIKRQIIKSNLDISKLQPGLYFIDINLGAYKARFIVD